MTKVVLKPASLVIPDVSREVGPQTQRAIRQISQALQQHEQAFVLLKGQQTTATAATTTATKAATATASTSTTLSLGKVNNQTDTSYTLQDGDYGGLVTFANANPVSLALNSACRQYWFGALENLGPGVVTVTPPSGNINGESTLSVGAGNGAWLFYDGVNWWAATVGTLPQTQGSASHEFLTGYDADTGQFTAAQPAFADIAGTATASQVPALSGLNGQIEASQLPVAGISATVALAALTPTGSQGVLTFTDGILTVYTPPS